MASIRLQTAKNPKALFIFAHGAGANMTSDFMAIVSQQLVEKNINVLRFNFPYMDKRLTDGKKYPPDRMPKLLACFEQVIEENLTELPVFIGGKSMGSRVAVTLLENRNLNVKGAVCLGYPFHPINKPEKRRLAPLQLSSKPVLILQGERDKLGNKAEIIDYDLPTHCQAIYFDDGDHDLKPRVKSGFTHSQHIESACHYIYEFITHYV